MSLDEIASQTRIPIRHLQNIEREEWDALPAPTYAVGFARNYANAVGLDGAEIARELRERIGGAVRTRAPAPEYYEPADPSRVPPRSIALFAALFAAVLIAVYFIWFSTLGGDDVPDLDAPVAQAPPAGAPAAAPQPLQPQAAAGQPVTLTATGEVWLRSHRRRRPALLGQPHRRPELRRAGHRPASGRSAPAARSCFAPRSAAAISARSSPRSAPSTMSACSPRTSLRGPGPRRHRLRDNRVHRITVIPAKAGISLL